MRRPKFADDLLGGNALALGYLLTASFDRRFKAGTILGIQTLVLVKDLKSNFRTLGEIHGVLHYDPASLDATM